MRGEHGLSLMEQTMRQIFDASIKNLVAAPSLVPPRVIGIRNFDSSKLLCRVGAQHEHLVSVGNSDFFWIPATARNVETTDSCR